MNGGIIHVFDKLLNNYFDCFVAINATNATNATNEGYFLIVKAIFAPVCW
jgi:hypothetical protein